MSIEANINYLDYEIQSNKRRIASMEKYLDENPSISIYKRAIHQRVYYYKKFRECGKSVSRYLGTDSESVREMLLEIQEKNLKRKQVKEKLKKTKKITTALEKQLIIARRATVHAY